MKLVIKTRLDEGLLSEDFVRNVVETHGTEDMKKLIGQVEALFGGDVADAPRQVDAVTKIANRIYIGLKKKHKSNRNSEQLNNEQLNNALYALRLILAKASRIPNITPAEQEKINKGIEKFQKIKPPKAQTAAQPTQLSQAPNNQVEPATVQQTQNQTSTTTGNGNINIALPVLNDDYENNLERFEQLAAEILPEDKLQSYIYKHRKGVRNPKVLNELITTLLQLKLIRGYNNINDSRTLNDMLVVYESFLEKHQKLKKDSNLYNIIHNQSEDRANTIQEFFDSAKQYFPADKNLLVITLHLQQQLRDHFSNIQTEIRNRFKKLARII